jgi:hypothetical protein
VIVYVLQMGMRQAGLELLRKQLARLELRRWLELRPRLGMVESG